MNKYAIKGIAALILMGLGGFLLTRYGDAEYKRGKAEALAEYNASAIDKGNNQNEIEYELRSLDNVDLIARYCRWVHDMPYSECVKAYNFIK